LEILLISAEIRIGFLHIYSGIDTSKMLIKFFDVMLFELLITQPNNLVRAVILRYPVE
jgi:hypothetical protein